MDESLRFEQQLLAAKLLVPHVPRVLVARPRLHARLDAILDTPLTLISAPAGFGKTTLVAGWLHQQGRGAEAGMGMRAPDSDAPTPAPRFAWVSLDPGDNSVGRFWNYVLAAFDRQLPTLALTSALDAPTPTVLATLINTLAAWPGPCVLTLDDYHVITDSAVHTSLGFLLDHLPPSLRLVLVTRSDPPLPLARLRARGALGEVRADHLRCTADEAATFFATVMGVALPPDILAAITDRTEGWLVGLHLIGLWMRQHGGPATILQALRGSHQYILDYLTEQVLHGQPPHIQQFLRATSILDRLSSEVCDAVMGHGLAATDHEPAPTAESSAVVERRWSSQELLEILDRSNLFVTALDEQRRAFRYHALFADALRYQLEQQDAAIVPTLHRRASRWYAGHGQPYEAIRHGVLGRDWPWAADLIEAVSSPLLLRQGEMPLLLRSLEQLPAETIRARPMLCRLYANLLLTIGQLGRSDIWLQALVERLSAAAPEATAAQPDLAERDQLLGYAFARRALIAAYYGAETTARQLIDQAEGYLADENMRDRAVLAAARHGVALINGEARDAHQHLLTASQLYRASDDRASASVFLGRAAVQAHLLGRLHEAVDLCRQAVALVEQPDGPPSAIAGTAWIYHAEVLLEWNQIDAADALVRQAIDIAQLTGYQALLGPAYAALLPIALARGDLDGAAVALEAVTRHSYFADNPYQRAIRISGDRVRLWLARGEIERAAAWADEVARGPRLPAPFAREREDVARVRIALAQRQPAIARALLAPLLPRAREQGRTDQLIELLVLAARAWEQHGDADRALAVLAEAVQLGEPEGYVRRFVDEGPAIALLLERLNARQPSAYLRTVLQAFSTAPRAARHAQPAIQQRLPGTVEAAMQPPLEPLSERERDVLQLLAQGQTNQQIAATLILAPNTIKNHVSRIFAKLRVTNRTQAVARARMLGLLDQPT